MHKKSFTEAPDTPSSLTCTTRPKKPHLIKCKLCKDILYTHNLASHACFISYNIQKQEKIKNEVNNVNLETNCGVRCVITGKQCTNYLTCRTHTLEEKRKVKGRLYTFDVLQKMMNKERKKRNRDDARVDDVVVDDELAAVVLKMKPVATKMWHFPQMKYHSYGIKSLFYMRHKSKNEGRNEGRNESKNESRRKEAK